MDKVLELFRKYDRSGDGTIGVEEVVRVLKRLDSSGFWTEERVKGVLERAGATSDTGRVGLEKFCTALANGGDYEQVRQALVDLMDSPTWDDGSYAPLLIRLAWHSSGTYSKVDGSGGSNGATMRHALEGGDPDNAGLAKAREHLEQVKAKFPWVSYADLWILAACVALEHTGGPKVPFRGGRMDAPSERAVAPGRLPGPEAGLAPGFELDADGRLKGWENLAQHIRDVFGRMGLTEQETVALICGGHVYGRCHTSSSGYKGAWVENPTRFANEYCVDMIGDKWIAVQHDTKMPDGGSVPDEVRPAPGKRQYIDLTKYEGEEEEKARDAPDAVQYPPGVYRCASDWVNVRESQDTSSTIVGRFNKDDVLLLASVKVVGTAIRGQALCGGWVSILGSSGKELFKREGDLAAASLVGRYRSVAASGSPFFKQPDGGECAGRTKAGDEFCVSEVSIAPDGAIYGKRADPGQGQGSFVSLFLPGTGVISELIIKGYNEQPRKALQGQTGHQMMLVSDMVLLWDAEFRKHLEVYAADEEVLKADFGRAFQRLTELGCSWSADRGPLSGHLVEVAGRGVGGGCPFAASWAAPAVK